MTVKELGKYTKKVKRAYVVEIAYYDDEIDISILSKSDYIDRYGDDRYYNN